MKNYIGRIAKSVAFIVISGFVTINGQAPAPWNYHFPLDITPKVSGSFGELRSNHFHSGLDLATRGKTGFPVFAAESGYVSRISVSPGGFGKALYITHPNGYTTVYAHLNQFNHAVDSALTALQYKKESFSVNAYFESGEYPVSRGEIIGFSGNSGSSGGPHLHFEVRQTRGQKPLDPLAFPNPVKDDIRPQIKGIKIYPLSDDALINGKHEARYFPCVFYDGAFHLKHAPRISAGGRIGVGIEVIDYYSGSWRPCGVHSIDLKINGQPHYNYTMDGFYFRDTRYLNSHIDYAEEVKHNRAIQKSFVDPFNKIDLYDVGAHRGEVLISDSGQYEFRYAVQDITGNISDLTFRIAGVPPVKLTHGNKPPKQALIDPAVPYSYEEDGYTVSFPAESFYRSVRPEFEVKKSKQSLTGKVFSVLDETIPIHKRYEIKIPIPMPLDKKGLCGAKISDNGKPVYAGGQVEDMHYVIRSRSGGDYILVKDTVPPKIKIRNKPAGMDYSRRKEMIAILKDDFSGIDEFEGRINGKWTLFEYDAKNDRIICKFDKVPFLEKEKEYELLIEATDQAGNIDRLETRFRY